MSLLASRTPRERQLILAAAIIVGLFALWQFGVRPVQSMKTQAQQSQQTALRDLDIVQRGLPRLSSQTRGPKAPFDRASVIAAARNANVAINRMQPAADDALQVWFEDTETPNVYRLLTDLSAKHNIAIQRVQITRRDTGRISAQVTLAPQ